MARNDYSRFFALLRRNPEADKESLVMQFTDGRTTSLREMSRAEFDEMCDVMQYGTPEDQELRERRLKKARSAVLLRIGRLGINTIDNWDGINSFCESPKIAGKRFYELTEPELQALVHKLESIIRKGGLKVQPPAEEATESQTSAIDYTRIIKLANGGASKFKS